MFARINSMGVFGMEAFAVQVEADLSQGLPTFDIVGLPDAAVKESRERVRSAIKNCGFDFPVSRITVNLAPGDIKKEGPIYDLPILVAILLATNQIRGKFDDTIFIGELSLSGDIVPINGLLPMAIDACNGGFKKIFCPKDNGAEASAVKGIDVIPVKNVKELIGFVEGKLTIEPEKINIESYNSPEEMLDFADVRGQYEAKRALEIAAAGGHNVLLIGPPGSGKSMLSKRLPSILPDMTFEESIEVTKIHSVAGVLPRNVPLITNRPFRSPHHTVSAAALAGGGRIPKPGKLSLAHNGVLFLDELPEFSHNALEVLRQPLEDRKVTIARVQTTLSYPCSVMLVCAMNPCPCGYYGHPTRPCTCTKKAVAAYLARVSGPLLDRLDLHVDVPPVEFTELNSKIKAESSADIKKRVNEARFRQQDRYKEESISCNANLTSPLIRKYCEMTDGANKILKASFDKLGLSARAYDRILKVAKTIADLEKSDIINENHIAESIQYRSLDRKYWTNL